MHSIFLLLFSLTLIRTDGCYIWGTDSGRCTTESTDADWRAINMPFCGKNAIQFPVCVPQHQVTITEHDGITKLGWCSITLLNLFLCAILQV